MNEFYGVPQEWISPLDWACDHLQLEEVSIVFDIDTLDTGDHAELVDYDDDMFYVVITPDLSEEDTIIALFHELCHVKQIIDGRLTFDAGPVYWQGEQATISGVYGDLPWEKEAFADEKIMYALFKETANAMPVQ